jgi:N-methylhydantoinase B
VLPSKTKQELRRGDVLTIYTAGGGGCGAPAERDAARIARDVRNGYVTREAALKAYGHTG